MTKTHTIEQLNSAVDALRSVDAWQIARDFEATKIDHVGHWVGVRLNPADGEFHTVCEASRNVSAEEYFDEAGCLSEMTVCSGQCGETPGPEDGYEWEQSKEGTYWGNDDGQWCCDHSIEDFLQEKFSDQYESAEERTDLEEIATSVRLYKFDVSSTPLDPDSSDLEKTIQELIDGRIELIESEIEELQQN